MACKVWTVEEAEQKGYVETEMFTSRLKCMEEFLATIQRRQLWLRRRASPRQRAELLPYAGGLQVLRNSFVIVRQSAGYRLWTRDIISDN